MPDAPKKLIREPAAAAYLDSTPATLRKWRHLGKGPGFVRLGRSVRYDVAELERFIEAHRARSTSDVTP